MTSILMSGFITVTRSSIAPACVGCSTIWVSWCLVTKCHNIHSMCESLQLLIDNHCLLGKMKSPVIILLRWLAKLLMWLHSILGSSAVTQSALYTVAGDTLRQSLMAYLRLWQDDEWLQSMIFSDTLNCQLTFSNTYLITTHSISLPFESTKVYRITTYLC